MAETYSTCILVEAQVDEAAPRHLGRHDGWDGLQLRQKRLGQSARIGSGALGEDHGRIGRQVAMRRIAGRFDCHRLAIGVGVQAPLGDQLVEDAVKKRGIAGVEAQFLVTVGRNVRGSSS